MDKYIEQISEGHIILQRGALCEVHKDNTGQLWAIGSDRLYQERVGTTNDVFPVSYNRHFGVTVKKVRLAHLHRRMKGYG